MHTDCTAGCPFLLQMTWIGLVIGICSIILQSHPHNHDSHCMQYPHSVVPWVNPGSTFEMQTPEKYFLGIEGSANKLGIGIVDSSGNILSNLRKTFVPPAGSGFLPGETARHHRQHIVQLLVASLFSSKLNLKDLEAICFTKGYKHLSLLNRSWHGCTPIKCRRCCTLAMHHVQKTDCSCKPLHRAY